MCAMGYRWLASLALAAALLLVGAAPTPAAPPGQLDPPEAERRAQSARFFLYDASAGDSLPAVADAFDADPAGRDEEFALRLAELNGIAPDASLSEGQVLLVPTLVPGDLAYYPAESIAAALGDALPLLLPGLETLAAYNGKLALHRLQLRGPLNGQTPGYRLEFWHTSEPITGARGDETPEVTGPAFVVAAGSLAETSPEDAGAILHVTATGQPSTMVATFDGRDPVDVLVLIRRDRRPTDEGATNVQIPEAPRQAAIADLSQRAGVPATSIEVVSAEAVDWPDACLGVRTPDRMCAQVITPGYRITLRANGKLYEYHTDQGSRAILAAGGG